MHLGFLQLDQKHGRLHIFEACRKWSGMMARPPLEETSLPNIPIFRLMPVIVSSLRPTLTGAMPTNSSEWLVCRRGSPKEASILPQSPFAHGRFDQLAATKRDSQPGVE